MREVRTIVVPTLARIEKAGDNMATGLCWRRCASGCSGVAPRLFSTTTLGSPDATSLCLILTRAHGERVLYVSMCTGAASVEVCARPCSSVLETACDVERQKVCMCV